MLGNAAGAAGSWNISQPLYWDDAAHRVPSTVWLGRPGPVCRRLIRGLTSTSMASHAADDWDRPTVPRRGCPSRLFPRWRSMTASIPGDDPPGIGDDLVPASADELASDEPVMARAWLRPSSPRVHGSCGPLRYLPRPGGQRAAAMFGIMVCVKRPRPRSRSFFADEAKR